MSEQQPFSIGVLEDESSVSVALSGEFDVVEIDKAITILQQFEHRDINVDITSLTFIDSSGLFVLADAYRSCEQNGCWLKIKGARPDIRRVFEVSGLEYMLAD